MTDAEKLRAYEAMQAEFESLYQAAAQRLERLKTQEKQKSASYRETLGWKIYYKNVLELYARYGLDDKKD